MTQTIQQCLMMQKEPFFKVMDRPPYYISSIQLLSDHLSFDVYYERKTSSFSFPAFHQFRMHISPILYTFTGWQVAANLSHTKCLSDFCLWFHFPHHTFQEFHKLLPLADLQIQQIFFRSAIHICAQLRISLRNT